MLHNEQSYLALLRDVMENGTIRPDRTGVGVKSVFGRQTRYNLQKGFPLLTTKKMLIKSIISELVWFIEGSGDERRLAEIRYGKDRSELTDKTTIWTGNARADYWKPHAKFEGDLSRIYGVQWRSWRTPVDQEDGSWAVKLVDQLQNLIDGIRRDPLGRRHMLTAWNPGELDQMALPPCHVMCQFYVDGEKLSCHLYQRSADCLLGVPYNIASYAAFTMMIAQVCGLRGGELVHTIGDAHVYLNHVGAVAEQLGRQPYYPPLLYIDPSISNIDDFRMEHFELHNYESHPPIKAEMAV
jgi:thymidylate synthase